MSTNQALSNFDYFRFRELVQRASGLDFSGMRRPDLERVVHSTLAETDAPDANSLFQLLSEGGKQQLLSDFISKLTIGETYFFRNQPQFASLEQHILPEIIARRRAERRLRLWSAGCASGEEPYSLAILLHRLLPDLADWNVLILATDISLEVLEKARRGRYGPWSFREVPAAIQRRYFSEHGRELTIVPQIRDMVTFAYLNLVEDTYPSFLTNTNAIDLIVCRNVTIYFHEETTRQIARRFYDSLGDQGWLVVGHAEPSQTIYHQFTAHNFPGTVVYQKGSGDRQAPSYSSAAPDRIAERWTAAAQLAEPWQGFAPDAQLRTAALPATAHRYSHGAKPRRAVDAEQPIAQRRSVESGRLHLEVTALVDAGHYEQALQQLNAQAVADPQNAQAPYLAAKIATNLSQLTAALDAIELAVQRAPLMAPAHYLHALILQQRNQEDAALAALRRCIYVDPRFILGHVALAGLYTRLGQPRRAQKAMETVAQLLAGRKPDELIAEGEDLTVGQLLELVHVPRT